jgi:hypothetical protein
MEGLMALAGPLPERNVHKVMAYNFCLSIYLATSKNLQPALISSTCRGMVQKSLREKRGKQRFRLPVYVERDEEAVRKVHQGDHW